MSHVDINQLNQLSDHRFALRFLLVAVAGMAIAGALTLFMHALIAFSQHELDTTSRANFLDFVRVKRDERSERKKVKPQRPKAEDAPPAPPAPQSNQDSMSDTGLQVSMPTASGDVNVNIGGVGIGTGDGEYLPIVKVAPAYPVKAAMNGTEGHCTVQYTVTTTGATRDVETVAGMCPPVFARASVKAARKFKYKPRVVNGEAIEVPQVRNRFEFNLQSLEEVAQ